MLLHLKELAMAEMNKKDILVIKLAVLRGVRYVLNFTVHADFISPI